MAASLCRELIHLKGCSRVPARFSLAGETHRQDLRMPTDGRPDRQMALCSITQGHNAAVDTSYSPVHTHTGL